MNEAVEVTIGFTTWHIYNYDGESVRKKIKGQLYDLVAFAYGPRAFYTFRPPKEYRDYAQRHGLVVAEVFDKFRPLTPNWGFWRRV